MVMVHDGQIMMEFIGSLLSMIFNDDGCWFMMDDVNDGEPRISLIHDGLRLLIMIQAGSWWLVMANDA